MRSAELLAAWKPIDRVNELPPWTPFVQERYDPSAEELGRVMNYFGLPSLDAAKERALEIVAELGERFINSRYRVVRRYVPATADCSAMVRLSINRRDGEPAGPERYRDFMRIKDELIGADHEAAELYPRRAREVDLANTYHLWGWASADHRFPFGMSAGRQVFYGPDNDGVKQQPLENAQQFTARYVMEPGAKTAREFRRSISRLAAMVARALVALGYIVSLRRAK